MKDERVRFAGYQIRHPLEKDVYLKVQTSDATYEAARRVCVLRLPFLTVECTCALPIDVSRRNPCAQQPHCRH